MPSISGDGDGVYMASKGLLHHHVNAEALDVFLHGGILEAASNQTLDIKEGPGAATKKNVWGPMGPRAQVTPWFSGQLYRIKWFSASINRVSKYEISSMLSLFLSTFINSIKISYGHVFIDK